MYKTTSNNSLQKHTAKTGYIYTLLAGALLVLLGLPAQGIAGQQMQIAALESAFNSHVVFGIPESYGEMGDDDYDVDDEPAASEGYARPDLMSSNSDNNGEMNDDDYDVDDEPAASEGYAKPYLVSSNSDNNGEMNDDDYDVDDEPAASENDAKSDAMFSLNTSFRLMVALNEQGNDAEEVNYGDTLQDED